MLEGVLLVERMSGTLPARHQEDVVPLPYGDSTGLLERGELQPVA